ncbi:MAG: hypothetical protein U1E28_22730 [Beijerinckiaceae bacterium]
MHELAKAIIAEVEAHGARLEAFNGKLCAVFDGDGLPDELHDRIREHKDALIAYLWPPLRPGQLRVVGRNVLRRDPTPSGPSAIPVTHVVPADLTDAERERWDRSLQGLTSGQAAAIEAGLAFGDPRVLSRWLRGGFG